MIAVLNKMILSFHDLERHDQRDLPSYCKKNIGETLGLYLASNIMASVLLFMSV